MMAWHDNTLPNKETDMQFELDAEVLRQALDNGFTGIQAATVLADLGAQLPTPLPTKPYAIIRFSVENVPYVFVLADPDTNVNCWVGGDINGSRPWGWKTPSDLPRVFTVISEGLDL